MLSAKNGKPLYEQMSALEQVRQLETGETTSRALLEHYIQTVQDRNPAVNAVIATQLDTARRQADAADKARKQGESLGPLQGLPMTIKDSYEVPGMPCTSGNPDFKDYYPTGSAKAVQRLTDAGAIVFGKTNVPLMTADIQTYNRVYGTTSNPVNPARTAGGSSGGAAAALALGMTPLELGSDIGGSIRIPAHFCGVYGHKSTHGIIPLRGHVPGNPGDVREPELAVAGPMARHAEDLSFMLDIIADSSSTADRGWQLRLPQSRHEQLRQFRVLMWIEDEACPIENQMTAVYQNLKIQLEQAGVDVTVGAPLGKGLTEFYAPYAQQLSSKMMTFSPAIQRGLMRAAAPLIKGLGKMAPLPAHADSFYRGAGLSHAQWLNSVEQSMRLQEAFQTVFDQYDVILAPPTFCTAFAHDHSRFLASRKVQVDGINRHYADLFMWIAPATLMGLPSTCAPVGKTDQGMPVGVQIIGAPYMDKTTIRFAECLAAQSATTTAANAA
ncbi:MAG: amidase [Pseudomonadales bacterium]|nr:amidase [Pseudomonadales bacterium]